MPSADIEKKLGVVIEVNAETDFVAKNELFQNVREGRGRRCDRSRTPPMSTALLACKMGDGTVEAALQEKVLVIGENIKIRRFERYEGMCAAYVHGGGTHGVLVNFDASG